MKILEVKRKNATTHEIAIYKVKLDDDVYDRVAQYQWHISGRTETNRLYAQRCIPASAKNARTKPLHREIIGEIPKGMDVDHINGDTFDNRRCNLRLATRAQNCANQGISPRNTSGFKGVSLHKCNRILKWRAKLLHNGKRIHIGCFSNPQDAARAYDAAAIRHFGEFAKTNEMMGLLKEGAK